MIKFLVNSLSAVARGVPTPLPAQTESKGPPVPDQYAGSAKAEGTQQKHPPAAVAASLQRPQTSVDARKPSANPMPVDSPLSSLSESQIDTMAQLTGKPAKQLRFLVSHIREGLENLDSLNSQRLSQLSIQIGYLTQALETGGEGAPEFVAPLIRELERMRAELNKPVSSRLPSLEPMDLLQEIPKAHTRTEYGIAQVAQFVESADVSRALDSASRAPLSGGDIGENHHHEIYLPSPHPEHPQQEVFFRRLAAIILDSLKDKSRPVEIYSVGSGGAAFEIYMLNVLQHAGFTVTKLELMDIEYKKEESLPNRNELRAQLKERCNVDIVYSTSIAETIDHLDPRNSERNVFKLGLGINVTYLGEASQGILGRDTSTWYGKFQESLGQNSSFIALRTSGLVIQPIAEQRTCELAQVDWSDARNTDIHSSEEFWSRLCSIKLNSGKPVIKIDESRK